MGYSKTIVPDGIIPDPVYDIGETILYADGQVTKWVQAEVVHIELVGTHMLYTIKGPSGEIGPFTVYELLPLDTLALRAKDV